MATRMRALDALLDLQRAVEGARRSNWLGASTAGYGTFPPINVFRQGHDFVLVAELPGVEKDSLDVQVKGRQVHLRGMKRVEFADGASVHRRERRSGAFRRSFTLPEDVDADAISATFKDGLLTLTVPKTAKAQARQIAIKSAA